MPKDPVSAAPPKASEVEKPAEPPPEAGPKLLLPVSRVENRPPVAPAPEPKSDGIGLTQVGHDEDEGIFAKKSATEIRIGTYTSAFNVDRV